MKNDFGLIPAIWPGRLLLLCLILGLAGCAASQKAGEPAADKVVQRAEARWEALLSNDLETAYTFYSPGYRSTVSLVDFGVAYSQRAVRYTSANYISHSCESQRCLVKIEAGWAVMNAVPGVDTFESKSTVEETWIFTEGQWWFLPKK